MQRRITLVNAFDRSRGWCLGDEAPSRVLFGSFFKIIRHTSDSEGADDIERIVIDRTATAGEFVELLAHVSENFAGDIVFIREGETSYVSAIGRGGGRVLYALREADVRFYLETHGLVARSSVAAA